MYWIPVGFVWFWSSPSIGRWEQIWLRWHPAICSNTQNLKSFQIQITLHTWPNLLSIIFPIPVPKDFQIQHISKGAKLCWQALIQVTPSSSHALTRKDSPFDKQKLWVTNATNARRISQNSRNARSSQSLWEPWMVCSPRAVIRDGFGLVLQFLTHTNVSAAETTTHYHCRPGSTKSEELKSWEASTSKPLKSALHDTKDNTW